MKFLAVLLLAGVAVAQEAPQQPQQFEQEQRFVQAAPEQQYYYQPSPYPYQQGFQNRQGVGFSAGIGGSPLDLSTYSPSNLITVMIYALGILSIVNFLLSIVPAPEARAATAAVAEIETG